ncbi:MAG: hypothetical protein C0448_09755 [Sphingobacteriaceae bacterium]|nr:hypothetical protein [Sphingobacteriaceae bacterium]
MKKILSIACLAILMFSFKAYAQSNITWTLKDNFAKGAIKTTTVLNSNFSGLSSKENAIAFVQKLKANPEVASCDIITNTGSSCDVKLVMKKAHDKMYYVNMAQKLGVAYIEVNGQKKTPAQFIIDKRNKKK